MSQRNTSDPLAPTANTEPDAPPTIHDALGSAATPGAEENVSARFTAHGDYMIPGTDELLTRPSESGVIRRLDKNLTEIERRAPGDNGWAEWNAHFTERVTATDSFVNHYHCPSCKHEWEDTASGTPNDRCPKCRTETAPYQSLDVDTPSASPDDPDSVRNALRERASRLDADRRRVLRDTFVKLLSSIPGAYEQAVRAFGHLAPGATNMGELFAQCGEVPVRFFEQLDLPSIECIMLSYWENDKDHVDEYIPIAVFRSIDCAETAFKWFLGVDFIDIEFYDEGTGYDQHGEPWAE